MSVVYLDTSAFVKLLVPERESAALESVYDSWRTPVASEILAIEAQRAARRAGVPDELTYDALARVALHPLTDAIRAVAGRIDPPQLRTLDAIHLATALDLREVLDAVVTYDARLAAAANAAQLEVIAPGA